MNSIFRKTLIASAMTVIFSTAAIAAEDYTDTIDGTTADKKSLNQQTIPGKNKEYNDAIDGKAPCHDDMSATGKAKGHDKENYGSENRPKTDHQKNVTNDKDDMKASDKNKNRDMEKRDSQNRPLTNHQSNVTEEEEEEEEITPRVSDEGTNKTEMNIQMEESFDSYKNDLAGQSSPASNLYSMSADELNGMDVVANDDEDIGHVSSIVLSPDQSEVHAVITVGSILGMGGRDVLVSLEELTLVNGKLHIKADQNEIAAMNDYGSEDLVELKGDAALSTAIRAK